MNTQLLIRALSAQSNLTDDEHDELLAIDRTAYAALLDVPAVAPETAMQIVVRLLAVTDGDRDLPTENRRMTAALRGLPTSVVLAGFESLVRRRVNNQRTSGAIRSFLFACPTLEDLAVAHKSQLARMFTHAMGRRTVSTCLHFLERPVTDVRAGRYLRRHILRYAADVAIATEVFRFVFGRLPASLRPDSPLTKYLAAKTKLADGEGLPYQTLRGIASTYHRSAPRYLVPRLARSLKVKRAVDGATALGDNRLVAALKTYLTHRSNEAWAAVRSALDVVENLPALEGQRPHWAVVVDSSGSMAGTGQRANHSLAIASAWQLLMGRHVRTDVFTTGDKVDAYGLAFAEGSTPLARALVEAARASPDAIVVLSDGYENEQAGDVADVLRAFAAVGVTTPIAHVLPAFTVREQLDERSPVGQPILETGDGAFVATWLRLLAALNPDALPGLLRRVTDKEDVR